jgi:hypothetical protein
MVLVDTSVWINHLRGSDPGLVSLLNAGQVLAHPLVIGELACGNLKDRPKIIANLAALPAAMVASDAEILDLIDRHKLYGQGLGWIDAHLLAAALLSHARLWTIDKSLKDAAMRFKLI